MIHRFGTQYNALDYRTALLMRSEMGSAGDFVAVASGTGSAVSFAPTGQTYSGRTGIASLETGTTTTGRASIGTQVADQIVLGSGMARFTAMIRTPSVLSDATNRYNIIVGFTNTLTTAAPTMTCSIRYRDNLNSGKWQAHLLDTLAGPETIDLGITVAVSTWYKLEIVVSSSSSQAQFYIDGALCGTGTLAVPAGVAETVGAVVLLLKGAGTTSRIAHCDFMEVEMQATR